MKVKDFAKRMADHGTKPRIRVFKADEHGTPICVYYGHPNNIANNIDEEIGKLKLNTFTVLGKGLVEIYAQ